MADSKYSSAPASEDCPTLVVGGGVVGVATAIQLRQAGRPVVLIERDAVGAGCSSGNSGLLSASGIIPHAAPGLLGKLPGYLMSRTAPLTVRAAALPHALPWFRDMMRFATRTEYERVAGILARLLALAQPAMLSLAESAGCGDLIRHTGTITLHESEASLAAARSENALRRRHGIEVVELSRPRLQSLEPALSPHIAGGSLMPANAFTVSPFRLVSRMGEHLRGLGGEIVRGEAVAIRRRDRGPAVVLADGRVLPARAVVLAAGAWTGRLARELGLDLRLGPHRGYNVMTRRPGVTLRHPLMWPDRGFAIVPMEDGIRAAGKVEIAEIEAPPDPAIPGRILAEMRSAFRSLDTTDVTEWMGVRPATPDSLPFIGLVPGQPDIAIAAGHGHLGMTLSAFTGQLVTELLLGRRPAFDPSHFALDRFGRKRAKSPLETAHV